MLSRNQLQNEVFFVSNATLIHELISAHAERQVSVMPRKEDVSSTSMGATLYPHWFVKQNPNPTGPDMPRPYWTPREGADRGLTLDKELGADSVFGPLQSSQGTEGPRMLPHYSETPAYIPPFDLARVGLEPKMSPVTDQENALLNLVPGFPVMCTAPPGLSRGQGRSGRSSCSGSPMSLGSPAVASSFMLMLKVHTCLARPSMFGGREEPARGSIEEEEEMDAVEDNDTEQTED